LHTIALDVLLEEAKHWLDYSHIKIVELAHDGDEHPNVPNHMKVIIAPWPVDIDDKTAPPQVFNEDDDYKSETGFHIGESANVCLLTVGAASLPMKGPLQRVELLMRFKV